MAIRLFTAKVSSCLFILIDFVWAFCATPTQWLPESPRFDILTGRTEKAMKTIANIAKENRKPVPQGRISVLKQVSLAAEGGDAVLGEAFQC